jgi:CheY-like chemotaxis protein
MQYAVAHQTSVRNEIEIVRADGSIVDVQNDVEPLYDAHHRICGCVSVCVDVTERHLAELGLRDDARRKDEFLATLSHELRNPLAPLRTAIEVMRLARGNEELVEKARTTMERQLLHLVRITDDLLDVSRITQDKVELRRERIDLRSVLQSAIEATRPLIDAQSHLLTVDLPQRPMWANADYTRLAQAFSNVLNNAAKYTERGGDIHVAACGDEAAATISVADTGVGIPPEMLLRIFDMFTQAETHGGRTHGGLGIGLTLAKRLIEMHGGTIDAASGGPGRGSRFEVRLPLVRAVDAATSRPAPESHARVRCRVLVAEDNPDAAEMMRVMLGFHGHEIRVAADGLQAVAFAETLRPNIAFLDIGMPRMDGYEAARRIRELLGPRVLLVALTGWGQDDDKRRAREAGFDHHITKPPEPEMIEHLIGECSEPNGV